MAFRFSRPPRYDRFGNPPYSRYIIVLGFFLGTDSRLQGRPVMSCCGARNLLLADRSQDFDRCHSFLLAFSATGGARKRPRFGNPPCSRYIIVLGVVRERIATAAFGGFAMT